MRESAVMAARPQSNNKGSNFVKEIEDAACTTTSRIGLRLLNVTVDGVLCESQHVMRILDDFLSGKKNHSIWTDPKQIFKLWWGVVIAGGETVGRTIGLYVVDPHHLQAEGVLRDLWRPGDFAMDLLVTRLCSFATVQLLASSEDLSGPRSVRDRGILALTLFFIRVHDHAVNGREVPARHRAVYIWCSMVFLTSIKGASVVTKRNIATEAIAFVFIVLCSDMPNPRHATSEPAEHMFGNLRQQIREFTILECSQLIEKLLRRLRLMFKNKLRQSRDPQYGYQATYREYFDYSMDVVEGVLEGAVDLTFDGGVAVAE